MKKIRVGVFGASGRMGINLSKLLKVNPIMAPSVAISRNKMVTGYKYFAKKLSHEMKSQADVWIDFSLPSGFDEILKFCVENKKPLVSGTTGLSAAQLKNMKKASKKIPILWSSNMSMGIVALKKALESLSILNDFKFQIEDIHHKMKLDSPSGTAKSLEQKLKTIVPAKSIKKIISIRTGNAVGTHRVYAISKEELLCFEHHAADRKVFAKGALWAAKKVVNLKPGLYSLEDLI